MLGGQLPFWIHTGRCQLQQPVALKPNGWRTRGRGSMNNLAEGDDEVVDADVDEESDDDEDDSKDEGE